MTLLQSGERTAAILGSTLAFSSNLSFDSTTCNGTGEYLNQLKNSQLELLCLLPCMPYPKHVSRLDACSSPQKPKEVCATLAAIL